MDKVDIQYIENIASALASSNISKLIELIPNISEEEANYYIKQYMDTMQEIRNNNRLGINTEKAYSYISKLTHDLYNRANLSGRKL